MFNPSRDEVRRFFADAWRKVRAQAPLEGLEKTAAAIILMHPEFHQLLEHPEKHLERDYSPEGGELSKKSLPPPRARWCLPCFLGGHR